MSEMIKNTKNNIQDILTIPREKLKLSILDETLNEYDGMITNVLFKSPNNDYMVAIFKESKSGVTFKITCQYVMHEESPIKIFGDWEVSQKWGKQFKSTSMMVNLELSNNGLVKFLTKSKDIKGIGEAKAKKIVTKYGKNFDTFLNTDSKILSKELSIKEDIIDNLKTIWEKHKATNAIAVNLSDYPLSQKHIMELVSLYGMNAIEKVKSDPYCLIAVLSSFGFKRADDIAMKNGISPDSVIRKQACLNYILMEIENTGSCWIEKDSLTMKMYKELNNVIYEDIEDFLKNKTDKHKVQIFENDNLIKYSSKHIFDKEKYIIDYIIANSDSCDNFTYEEGPTDDDLATLNEDQKKAVLNSFRYNFSVITGKAGTGKTFVISKIVEIFRRIGLDVACVAPTGKAARRMEEMTKFPASTIHRLLGYNGNSFSYNENSKLCDHDVIIVDEFSMVGIELGYNLLSALADNVKVIIVGDHNQLTSIGAGNIFNDILKYNERSDKKIDYKISVLDKVVRQAGNLKKNSVDILDGKISFDHEKDWQPSFSDQFDDDCTLSSFIVDLMSDTEKYVGYPLKDVQLIVPMKKESIELSTFRLNKLLQKSIQYKKYGNFIEPTKFQDNLYLHDKVMQIKNDYQIEIMNGTIGTVSYISDDGDITIDFEGGVSIEYQKNDILLKNIVLAYAMTTHKTQGSEYPCVIVVMHNSHYNMLNRNLLYTAVTRAKEKVLIYGDRKSIAIALSKNDTSDKKTNFNYHIENSLK